MRANETLKFPEYCYVSRNHFHLEWTLSRTLRRLKNVIIVMEWEPSMIGSMMSGGQPKTYTNTLGGKASASSASVSFNSTQERAMERCFNMFDVDRDGKLARLDIERLLSLLGVKDYITADILEMQYSEAIRAKGGFTYGVFRDLVKDLTLQFRKQEGRYYSLLSLHEAEHFRGVLHARASSNSPLLRSEATLPVTSPITSAAIWLFSDLDATLLGTSKGYQQQTAMSQHNAMVSSYRFLNSESYFTDNGLITLLRILENNPPDDRAKWWVDIRSCRRRRQVPIDASVPVSVIFSTASEYEFLEYKSVIERVKYSLSEKGMLIFDAFRAFNSSNSGLLTCSEINGGMYFLDIPFTTEQIHDLVRRLAIHNEGLVSYVDFKRVFGGADEEIESRNVGGGQSNFEAIPPRNIPELADVNRGQEEPIQVTDDILQNFKVKAKPILAFTEVWNSQGTQSESQVSIWCPSLQTAMLTTASKTRICLGYFAIQGFQSPSKSKNAARYMTIEITDFATMRMKRNRVINSVLSLVFPHPVRFKQTWHLARNGKVLYAWKVVPPEGFVALGYVCTVTG